MPTIKIILLSDEENSANAERQNASSTSFAAKQAMWDLFRERVKVYLSDKRDSGNRKSFEEQSRK